MLDDDHVFDKELSKAVKEAAVARVVQFQTTKYGRDKARLVNGGQYLAPK